MAVEDFLAVDRAAGDVETTSCPKSTAWVAQYIFALRVPDNGIYLYGSKT